MEISLDNCSVKNLKAILQAHSSTEWACKNANAVPSCIANTATLWEDNACVLLQLLNKVLVNEHLTQQASLNFPKVLEHTVRNRFLPASSLTLLEAFFT